MAVPPVLATSSTAQVTVSTREAPWMKIGKLVDKPMTAAEAARLGGLDFTVVKCSLYYEIMTPPNPVSGISQSVHKLIDDRVAVVRPDTGAHLGIMSKNYPVLQYEEAFDFMDTVRPTYVAAGCLKGGRQGFLVVEAPTSLQILGGDDPHDLYAVLRTSHDGSRAVEVTVMPLRGRCMNQLTLHSFTAGVPHRWSIKHTSTMMAKLSEAQKSLGNVAEYAKRFTQTAETLAKIKVNVDTGETILRQILPNRPRRDDQIERIITLWQESETGGYPNRGWGLVNAVSEFYDWGRGGGNAESRFIGALQGSTTITINRVAARLLSRV